MKFLAFLVALLFFAKVKAVALRGNGEEEDLRALVEEGEDERELIEEGDSNLEALFLESPHCEEFMSMILKAAKEFLNKPNEEVVDAMCSEHGRHELWKAEEDIKEDLEKKGNATRRMLSAGDNYRRLEEATEEEILEHCITSFQTLLTEGKGKEKVEKTIHSRKECRKEIRQELRVVDDDNDDDGTERRLMFADGSHRQLGFFKKLWGKIKTGAQKVVAVVTTASKKVIEVAKVAVKKGVKVLKETGTKVINSALAGNFSAIGGHLREAGGKLKEIGKEAGAELKKICQNATSEAIKIGAALADEVGDDILVATQEAHQSAIKYAKKACNTYFGEATKLGGIEGANSKCHELVKDAEEAGAKAIDKAAKEVVAIAEKVKDVAEEEAEKAIQAAQKRIDEAIEKGTKAAEGALADAEELLAKAEKEKDRVIKEGTDAIEAAKKKVEEMVEVAKQETREALGALATDELPSLTETEFPCSPADPCDVCEGDCDEDADCEGELKCMERTMKKPFKHVPGCKGEGKKAKDYCYAPGAKAAEAAAAA